MRGKKGRRKKGSVGATDREEERGYYNPGGVPFNSGARSRETAQQTEKNKRQTDVCLRMHPPFGRPLLPVLFSSTPATSNRKKTPRKTLVYSILYGLIKMCQNETRSTHQDEAKVYAMLSNKQLVFVFPRGCMMRASCRCNSFIIAEFGSLDLELCVIHDFS